MQHDVASGGDKLAAAIQKPTAEQQSAQSVMAAQSNGKGTGGRGAGMATMMRQTEAEVAAGAEAGVPSPVQQLLQRICDQERTRAFMVQMNRASFEIIGGSLAQHAVQHMDIHICLNLLGCRACLMTAMLAACVSSLPANE